MTAWSRSTRARVVAIADPDRAAASRLAAGTAPVFASLAEALRGAEVDAVDIATPVGTHAALVAEAASAGLPILCQKPLAPTARQAQGLVDALPPNARVMLHENWRWRGGYRALKGHLSGRPRPKTFRFQTESSGLCPASDGSFPALVRQPFLADLDRLVIFELLGHHLDVLTFLFGPVEVTGARIGRRCLAVRGDDNAEIRLIAGGIPGELTGDFTVPTAPARPRDRLAIDGRTVIFDWHLDLPGMVRDWDHAAAYQESYDHCISHFANCVLEGSPFETPLEHGVTLLRLVEAAYDLAGPLSAARPAERSPRPGAA